ncbi:twin-arginine translocase TatA/TatE family subunit [Opitutaceae bacterium TAV4]|nr:twin-arginine translocase TatA/TatE family subunit [Opitutaceae bacterium TAV4]RRK02719.1 twin-arginine translocase TatA/TatE family subunit [Opitutaceae bacterium TAV3]
MTLFSSLPLGVLGLGAPELVVIMLIVLLLFGGAKLPKLARGLGQSIKEFKKAQESDDEKDEDGEQTKSSSTKTVSSESGPQKLAAKTTQKSPSDN